MTLATLNECDQRQFVDAVGWVFEHSPWVAERAWQNRPFASVDALHNAMTREIRRYQPEVVITGDPTVVWAGDTYINHPDHRAVAFAAVDAIFPAAGQPNLFEELAEEGLRAHKVRKVYVMNWGEGGKETFSRHALKKSS